MNKVKGRPASTVKGDSILSADTDNYKLRQSLIDFVDALEARGLTLRLRRNRLNAGADQKLLTTEERAFINKHRAALKEILQDPQRVKANQVALPVADTTPDPIVYAYYRDIVQRVTADTVKKAAISPSTPKQEAFQLARQWLETQFAERDKQEQLAAMNASRGRARGSALTDWSQYA